MAALLLHAADDGWTQRPFLQPVHSEARPAASWNTFVQLHARCCSECTANSHCTVRFALDYVLGAGHSPRDILLPAPRDTRRLPASALSPHNPKIPLSPPHAAFVRRKHEEWAQLQVVSPAPGPSPKSRSPSQREPGPDDRCPTFVIDKYKLRADKAQEALDWITEHPREALEMAHGNPMASCPTAFKLKRRAVYDLTGLNRWCKKLQFAYPTLADAVTTASGATWLAALDLAEGFTAIRLADDASQFLRCSADGSPDIEHKRAPFGYTAAPALFCFISAEATSILTQLALPRGSATVVYMDDIMLALPDCTLAEARQAVESTRLLLSDMGLNVQAEKLQGPGKTIEFLGVQMTRTTDGVSLEIPSHKAALYHVATQALLASQSAVGSVSTAALRSIAGKMAHVYSAVPSGSFYMASIWSELRRRARPSGRVLSANAVEALTWFRDWMAQPQRTAGSVRKAYSFTRVIVATTDASGTGGLGAAYATLSGAASAPGNPSGWLSGYSKESLRWQGHKNSMILELLAVEWLLSSLQRAAGMTLAELFTDSSSAAALLRRHKVARSPNAAAVIDRIRAWAERKNIVLLVRHIRREDNTVADLLSRPAHPAREAAAAAAVADPAAWRAHLHLAALHTQVD